MAYIVQREIPKSCKDCQFHHCSEYHPFWVENKEKRNTKTFRCQAALPFRSTVLDIDDETFKPDWCPLVDVTDTNVGHKSEWISVEERLPDQYEDVLGFCHYVYESGGVCDLILTMKLTTDGKFVPFNCSPLKEGIVTHWMPLPEPPKGE